MRIDFYQTGGRFRDVLDVACVLAGKAWPENRSIAIVGPRPVLDDLDARLWRRPAGRFLPHGIEDKSAPIRLLEAAPDAADVLINLDPHSALPAGRYARVLEIVPPDETARQALRKRWLAWKDQGADLHHHVLK